MGEDNDIKETNEIKHPKKRTGPKPALRELIEAMEATEQKVSRTIGEELASEQYAVDEYGITTWRRQQNLLKCELPELYQLSDIALIANDKVWFKEVSNVINEKIKVQRWAEEQ